MSLGHNSQGSFGYPLHIDEHRGPAVDFEGIDQIPPEVRRKIDHGGEDWLDRDEQKLMDTVIAKAKRDLFQRHLAALRAQTGGNQYDAEGRYIGDREDDEAND